MIIGGCVPTDLENAIGGVGGRLVYEFAVRSLK